MSSTRLPGKVLRPLAGMPVLQHVVARMQRATSLDVVAIATSSDPSDDPLEAFAAGLGIPCIRGPLDDVLARYVQAARALSAEVLVRVTGDAPLVDPRLTDLMVSALIAADADFVGLQTERPVCDEGFTPMSRRILERLAAEHGDHPVAREHVSGYRRVDPAFGRQVLVPLAEDRYLPGVRLSVDTPADLAFLEAVYAALGVPAPNAEMLEVIALLRRRPDLMAINAHVRQKQVDHRPLQVLVRCDGGAGLGLGHVRRCLAIAETLRDGEGATVHAAIVRDDQAAEAFQALAFRVHRPPAADPEPAAEARWLCELAAGHDHQAILLDLRNGLGPAELEALRGAGLLVAVLDDPAPRRLAADLAFYPPAPAGGGPDWTGFRGELHAGWDWLPLARNFARPRPDPGPALHSGRILLSLGGADPEGLAPEMLQALRRALPPSPVDLVVGPAVPWAGRAAELAGDGVRLLRGLTDLAPALDDCALAVLGFGVTAHEAAARGRGSVLLCRSQADLDSAGCLAAAGIARMVDLRQTDWAAQAAAEAAACLADPAGLAAMGERAAALVDGQGATRIAAALAARIRTR